MEGPGEAAEAEARLGSLTATRLASLEARSGEIMRRLLRDIAEGRALGDTPTLADPTVVATLKEKYESEE